MFDDPKFGNLFPTRTGTPSGTANERKMLDTVGGAEGFRTRMQNATDGSVTMLRTRNGMPEFSTTTVSAVKQFLHGGFVLHPSDGVEDPIEPDVTHSWDKVFYKTMTLGKAQTGGLYKPVITPPTDPELKLHTSLKTKPVSWTGTITSDEGVVSECVVTWDHGLGSRYRLHADQDCSGRIKKISDGEPELAQSGTPGICIGGSEVRTSFVFPDGELEDVNVVGAAVFSNMLVFVAHIDPTMEAYQRADKRIRAPLCSTTVTVFYRKNGAWEVAGSHKVSTALKAPWFFSPDGSRASAIREPMASNQWLMHIDLMIVDGKVVSSFSETGLDDAAQFYLDTTSAPTKTPITGPTGRQQPGPWKYYAFGQNATSVNTQYFAFRQVGDFISGTRSVADEIQEDFLADTGSRYTEGDLSQIRTDQLETFTNNVENWDKAHWVEWGIAPYGVTEGMNFYAPIWGTLRGHIGLVARRDGVRFINDNTGEKEAYLRSANGLRYIAVDYGFGGEFLVLSERLTSENAQFSRDYVERNESTIDTPSANIDLSTQASHKVSTFNITGVVKWEFKINSEAFLVFAGGGDCSSSLDFINKTETTVVYKVSPDDGSPLYVSVNDPPTTTVSTFDTHTYSTPSGSLYTERAWVIDADLRTKSCVYEKIRDDFRPNGPAYFDGINSVFGRRIECEKTTVSSLYIVHNGVEVFRKDNTVGTGTKIIRPYSAMMEMTPRVHDLSENIEETSIIQHLQWKDGTADLEAWRHHYLLENDLMPRSAGEDSIGQIQSRNLDQTIISARDNTTAQIKSLPGSGQPSTKLHDLTYITYCNIRGDVIPLLIQLADKLVSDKTSADYALPDDGFRIFPINAI